MQEVVWESIVQGHLVLVEPSLLKQGRQRAALNYVEPLLQVCTMSLRTGLPVLDMT